MWCNWLAFLVVNRKAGGAGASQHRVVKVN